MDLSERDRVSQGHNKVRIVIVGLRLSVAKVEDFKVSLTQHGGQVLLQFKTAVIGSNTDA
jgi:hypothetical protein